MKSLIYILLGLLLFAGCNKEKVEKASVHELSVLKNGEAWVHDVAILEHDPPSQIEAFWNIIGGDSTCDITMSRTKNPVIEYVYFARVSFKKGKCRLIPDRPGTHVLNTVKSGYYYLIGGDAGGRSFEITSYGDNYILIDSIDRGRSIIAGQFQATYLAGGDTIRFTEGKFRTSVSQLSSE